MSSNSSWSRSAGGHVLLEDVPGLAKTLTARPFARVLDLDFRRIQFTPDLMPADVTGSSVWDQHRSAFDFRPGPIFCNLLLADEINRTPPKTQAALLEAMGESQVTMEGSTRPLDPPFVVLATQNPIEYEGTYPLPEAQLDRFLFRSASATRRSRTSGSAGSRLARRRGPRARPRGRPSTLLAMRPRSSRSMCPRRRSLPRGVGGGDSRPAVEVGGAPRLACAPPGVAREPRWRDATTSRPTMPAIRTRFF